MDVWVVMGGSNAVGDNGFQVDPEPMESPTCLQERPDTIKMWSDVNQVCTVALPPACATRLLCTEPAAPCLQAWVPAVKQIHDMATKPNATASDNTGFDL
jgi:hypothetical protein